MEFKIRDRPKRLMASVILAGVLVALGHILWAVICLCLIVPVELARVYLNHSMPRATEPLSDRRLATIFVVDMLGTSFYCAPSLFFFLTGTQTGLLTGTLWLVGVTIHNVGGLALIKVWCWAALIPIIGTTAISLFLIYGQTFAPPRQWDWIILLIASLMYCSNIIEVMRRQRENRDAFSKAQAQAEDRLRQLEYLARHDPLTGLLNRRAFDRMIGDRMQKSADGPIALLLIDLDGFKQINDTYGHRTGDDILRLQASRIHATAPNKAARLGGDEFAVLIDDADCEDQITEMAQWLDDRLHDPLDLGESHIRPGASIGVAFFEPGISSPDDWCHRADQAMYEAKAQKRGKPHVWTAAC